MVNVIYVGATGRSGSTLVDRVIGQIPGYVSVGEVRVLWSLALAENRLCGCGRRFLECPFWGKVGEVAYGGWEQVDAREVEASLASLGYPEAVRQMLGRSSNRHGQPAAAEGVLERLYAGISAASDGATIIDSSKGPRYGFLLSTVRSIDLKLIHLIRDSRGVAHSWAKEVTRPDTPGRTVLMPRQGATSISLRWNLHNALFELIGRHVPLARLQYESFTENPRAELTRVLGELGRSPSPADLAFLDDRSVELEPNHTVMGNPMRMATGRVALTTDLAWRRDLPRRQRAVVTALTWPLMRRYGYRL